MRTKPYTAIGIKRMRCVRCGEPAHAQWNACADGVYRPICVDCDIGLNNIVLAWMKIEDVAAKMKAYRETMSAKRRIPARGRVIVSVPSDRGLSVNSGAVPVTRSEREC